VLAAAACALLGIAGCGEEQGVADGATVTVYVTAPLCAGAQRELASEQGRVGSVRVRAVCLDDAEDGTRLNLATVGANARRATEDSTTVAYLEARDPAASRFSRPIVDSANIARVASDSGRDAMEQVLGAIGEADSDSLRDSVREILG
jgi:hypothetical protein